MDKPKLVEEEKWLFSWKSDICLYNRREKNKFMCATESNKIDTKVDRKKNT